jgi:hypothetical protein
VGNSGHSFEQWHVSRSDGAYPRPEGRGIAPVQRITFEGNDAGDELHLAAFEIPGPFRSSEIDSQELYDTDTSSAEGDTLTVDVPDPNDYRTDG